jgi:hypothetical protein
MRYGCSATQCNLVKMLDITKKSLRRARPGCEPRLEHAKRRNQLKLLTRIQGRVSFVSRGASGPGQVREGHSLGLRGERGGACDLVHDHGKSYTRQRARHAHLTRESRAGKKRRNRETHKRRGAGHCIAGRAGHSYRSLELAVACLDSPLGGA